MNKILKALKELKAKGWASKAEKAALEALAAELKSEDREVIADQIAEVNALADEDPSEKAELEKGIKTLLASAAEGMKEDIKNEIKEYVKANKELIEKKAGVYADAVQEKRKALNSSLRNLVKSLVTGEDTYCKEMSTDATGTPYAGYTVDTELSAEIRHLVTEYGVARREMTTLPLSKHDYKANNLATDISVNWVDEASAIASSQLVLGQGTLSLNKLAVIVTLTSELLEDTEIDFVNFIGSRVAEGFAEAEDEAYFNGDGSSTYGSFTGLLENASVNEVTMTGSTFASVTADDFIDMVDATPSGALANGKFYMNRTIMSYVRKLQDADGRYIYQAPSERGPATLWGYPVVLVEVMPTKTDTAAETPFVLFGDLRKACILGYKASGLSVEQFNAGIVRNVAANADINLITTDRKAIRFIERTGYVVIVPTAVTKLTTGAVSA